MHYLIKSPNKFVLLMDDEKIIKKYFYKLSKNNPSSLNLNDDVFFDKKKHLVISTDTYNEKIHYKNLSHPDLIIKKIIRSSISDLICKGVKPKYIFISASINKKLSKHKNFLLIINSLKNELKKYKILLCGGDTTFSKVTSFTITTVGFSKKIVKRNKTKLNDIIYVTGSLGDSYAGLLVINKKLNCNQSFRNYFKKKYYVPDIPYKFYKYMQDIASSSMDISDGLILDLERMMNKQNLNYHINLNQIPISNKLKQLIDNNKLQKENFISKGDDYQILFTSPFNKIEKIKKISKRIKIKITAIGRITKGDNLILNSKNKNLLKSMKNKGYLHKFA